MASIDDVNRNINMLLDALVRTAPDDLTGGMGQVGSFPGLAPRTYRAARTAHDAVAEVLTVVNTTNTLLNAVNVDTLGRIEARASDNGQGVGRVETAINDGRATLDPALDRIESSLKQIMDFLPTLRTDLSDLRATLDAIAVQRAQDKTDLDAKLAVLAADIKALPH